MKVRLGPGVLGTFEGDVADHEMPEGLLSDDRAGNVHSLWVDAAAHTPLAHPVAVDVMVVVHPPVTP